MASVDSTAAESRLARAFSAVAHTSCSAATRLTLGDVDEGPSPARAPHLTLVPLAPAATASSKTVSNATITTPATATVAIVYAKTKMTHAAAMAW